MGIQVKESRIAFGVDVGGTGSKAAGVEIIDGEPARIIKNSSVEVSSDVAKGPEFVANSVVTRTLRESLKKSGIRAGLVDAVGVDFPCAIDAEKGRTLDVANMKHPAWGDYRMATALKMSLQTIKGLNPGVIKVENDGAAAMFGLRFELPPSEQSSIILGLFVGTGVGGGAIVGGKNIFNNTSGGSEPGATHVVFDENRKLLGRPGRAETRKLEDFVSITAIERQLQVMHKLNKIPKNHILYQFKATGLKSEWRVRAEKVLKLAVDALENGKRSSFSLKFFQVQRAVLGLYLQDKIQFLRPDHIFIGGGVVDPRRVTSKFRDWYVNGIRDIARGDIAQTSRRRNGFPEFHTPIDGDFVAPKGAALMAAEGLGIKPKKKWIEM